VISRGRPDARAAAAYFVGSAGRRRDLVAALAAPAVAAWRTEDGPLRQPRGSAVAVRGEVGVAERGERAGDDADLASRVEDAERTRRQRLRNGGEQRRASVPAMRLNAIAIAVLAACSQPAATREPLANSGSASSATPAATPAARALPNAWASGMGCTPKGDELAVTGALVVRPFGKGTDGAVIQADDGEWILSYRAEGALLDLAGTRVTVRGRACDKQGEATAGRHFDAASIVAAPSP
jgi:hypothetical protein